MKVVIHRTLERKPEPSGVTLSAFAEENNLTMAVRQRHSEPKAIKGLPRFWAWFEWVDVLEGSFRVGVFGNGETPEDAIADYAEEISGKTLAVNSGKPDAHTIKVPVLAGV